MAYDRATLRTRARIRADQDSSDFPSDTAYNYYLDEARTEVWKDLLMAGWQVDYTTVNLTATGATSYQITNSGIVFSVLNVFRVDGTTKYQMGRLDPSYKAEVLSTTVQPALYYELRVSPTLGAVIRFYPTPAAGNYQVDYIPEIPGFTGDGDTWYGPPGSDELLVLRAASKGMTKEGRLQDASSLEGEYQRVMRLVQDSASWLDQRNPARIRDVNRTAVRDPFAYPVVGPDHGLMGFP